MATDLAEFIGAAIGIHLLFPACRCFVAGVITAFAAFGILAIQSRGFRVFEAVIIGLVGVIVAAFAFEVILDPAVGGGEVVTGLSPRGSTAPRACCSAPASRRDGDAPRHLPPLGADPATRGWARPISSSARSSASSGGTSIIAMSVAGADQLSMLTIAAGPFYGQGIGRHQRSRPGVHRPGEGLATAPDIVFGLGLLASGLSSSSVGTLAGQVVMQGFIRRRIPLFAAPGDHHGARAGRHRRRPRPDPIAGAAARSCCRSESRSPSCPW